MANKPWSSGRILTPSQRERKRMKDRALKRGKRILYHQRTNEMEARLQRLEILNATYFGLFTSLIMLIEVLLCLFFCTN